MSQVVGLPNNSYKPITNTAWVRTWLCKLQKGCTRLTPASDKVGRWFSQGTPAFSTTITGRYDIAEILQKMALNPINNQSIYESTYHFGIFNASANLKTGHFFLISAGWYNVRMVTLTEYLSMLLHCVVLSITSCSANRKSTVHSDNLSFQSRCYLSQLILVITDNVCLNTKDSLLVRSKGDTELCQLFISVFLYINGGIICINEKRKYLN
jgi:hypothetical protein